MNNDYRAIVVGAGHAGIESALALARLGIKTLILCLSLESVGLMACNPSIGGTAKAHLVCEIDALGGEMARAADKTLIQLRMLNRSKGAAVQSLRAQVDKYAYHSYMKSVLENQALLDLRQGEVCRILTSNNKLCGVELTNGLKFSADAVILACGVYLKSKIITGELVTEIGPCGLARANDISNSLQELGFKLRRFKTGTPARVHRSSIDLDKLQLQEGEQDAPSFSRQTRRVTFNREVCYLGWTSTQTHDIIRKNLENAPLFSGTIKGIGARYCPSIEDKVVRFADKERHQFFLEPEGLNTQEMYVQGLSTSLPARIQEMLYRSIYGFEKVKIMRDAYAIEYDCINPLELTSALMSKRIEGLFFAGQINGTSGYEEAAAQGLIAGINAAQLLKGQESLIIKRSEGYIGVLIDDLVTKGTDEPYRMMTSRAEFRILLRQDNADMRLTELGNKIGLVSKKQYMRLKKKIKEIGEIENLLANSVSYDEFYNVVQTEINTPLKLRDVFLRSNSTAQSLKSSISCLKPFSVDAIEHIYLNTRFGGYVQRQQRAIDEQNRLESAQIPSDFDYNSLEGVRIEARQKLALVKPSTIGQASRISGVNPSDINILILNLSRNKKDD